MTGRERFLLALAHKEGDRIPICDTPWETTLARWRREGFPQNQSPHQYFGYERTGGGGADLSFRFLPETIEETDTYKIVKDGWGATTRVFKGQESVPELIDYTVTSREKWEELKPRYLWNDSRVPWESHLRANRAARGSGLFVQFAAGFGFDRIQRMVGMPRVLIAMKEEPDWVKEMMDMTADLIIAAAEEMIHRGFVFDGVFIWNDQAYRNGPFFSPALWRELEFPNQKRMCDFFHSKKLPVIVHTDGDVRPLIPMMIEAGYDCLQPLEAKAGMDLGDLKKKYGDVLAFMGGIDTRAMAHPDPAVIEKEIRTKIPVAKKGGGYIYHSDHSVPDNVSFEQYKRVMDLVLKYGTY
jgi:uroporphyrinogen decarboxylase